MDNTDEARRRRIHSIDCYFCRFFAWVYIQQPTRSGEVWHHPNCPVLPTNQEKSGLFYKPR